MYDAYLLKIIYKTVIITNAIILFAYNQRSLHPHILPETW